MDTSAALLPFAHRVRGFGRVRLPPVGGLISGTLAASGFAAIAVVAYAGMRFEAGPFVQFLLLAAAMAGIWSWCSVRNLDRRLGDAALVVATGTCALLACGIISNAGLRLGAPTVDSWLLRADAVLGIQVETVVRSFARHPAIIAILNWVYNASSLAVVGLIAAQLAGGRRRLVWEMLATIVIAMQVIALCSIATPAIGAMNVTGMMDLQGNGLPAGAGVYHLQAFQHFYAGTDPVLRLSDMNGLVTFPSFHTVLALMATQALAETRWRWLAVGWTAAVIVSTIPIGGHYVIDLVAGFAIWAAAAAIARRVNTPSA